MPSEPWTEETLLDISVNIVPFVVLVGFVVLFLGYAYWGVSLTLIPIIQFAIIFVMAAVLLYVTYFAAKKIEG